VDETIVFHTLDRDEIGQIVHILMREIDERLADEDLTLSLSEAATDFLVGKGFDQKFGARPLRRAIQRYLENPLSEKILTAEFSPGDEIVVDLNEDGEGLTMAVASRSKT
jgi:ATP-dependent Clp protease ATP-binding subunit ClpC